MFRQLATGEGGVLLPAACTFSAKAPADDRNLSSEKVERGVAPRPLPRKAALPDPLPH